MRLIFRWILILPLFIAGCSQNGNNARQRPPVRLEDLAVTVSSGSRACFFSDRRGGILLQHAGKDSLSEEWSVNGRALTQSFGVFADSLPFDRHAVDSVRISPLETTTFFVDGSKEIITIIDHVPGMEAAHALVVNVQTGAPRDIALLLNPSPDFRLDASTGIGGVVTWKGERGSLVVCVAGGTTAGNRLGVPKSSSASFLILYAPGSGADSAARQLLANLGDLRSSRRERMERLLNRSYIRTSDPVMTFALQWLQVSLDAMTVESADTLAIPVLPWDGTYNMRDNAIALAGLDIATGQYATTASMLRAMANHQDVQHESRTWGRIPETFGNGAVSFRAADPGAWMVREMYEHVVASGDTAIVRQLYPAVLRGITGTSEHNTDEHNFFVHGDDETWMHAPGSSPRGNRAAEVQALWYNQQAIGSIFASFLKDTLQAARWASQAELTSTGFNQIFVDTARGIPYDHLTSSGAGTPELRPNLLLCLDIIESEAVREHTVKSLMKALLREDGVASLDSGTVPRGGKPSASLFDGPVWNWMAGQMVYALTRYDRQDLTYPITRRMAGAVAGRGMIGTLPALASPAMQRPEPASPGSYASVAAMGEFLRSFYQDYLGVHINMTTKSLAIEPKLPDDLAGIDCTVFAGSDPVQIAYDRKDGTGRLALNGNELRDSLRVTFLWMLPSGNAWRGSTWLPPHTVVTIGFGEDDAVAFRGDARVDLQNTRKLKGFSQRNQISMEN